MGEIWLTKSDIAALLYLKNIMPYLVVGYNFYGKSFKKTCEDENLIDLDRKGAEIWRNMTKEVVVP